MSSPRLTVAIATYNRARYLEEAIASVLDQSFDDYVLRIVDDASSDETADVVRSFADPRIEYIRQDANQGWLANCNRALGGIDTELATLLGDDDTMVPDRLERAVKLLDAHPSASFLHAAFNYIDEQGTVLAERVDSTRDLHGDALERGDDFIRKGILYGNRVCSQTVVLRTAALPPVPFDPRDSSVADYSLWLTLALSGDVVFSAQPAVNYRVHAGSDSAIWSNVDELSYRPGPRLIARERRMKRRFIAEHAERFPDASKQLWLADFAVLDRYLALALTSKGLRWLWRPAVRARDRVWRAARRSA